MEGEKSLHINPDTPYGEQFLESTQLTMIAHLNLLIDCIVEAGADVDVVSIGISEFQNRINYKGLPLKKPTAHGKNKSKRSVTSRSDRSEEITSIVAQLKASRTDRLEEGVVVVEGMSYTYIKERLLDGMYPTLVEGQAVFASDIEGIRTPRMLTSDEKLLLRSKNIPVVFD